MPIRKTLYFVRHGQTDWNAIMRMQGQWDSQLTEAGKGHAAGSGELLKRLGGVEKIYASPLLRTRQTADIVSQKLGLPYEQDDRLKEWDSGDWSGHLYADIKVQWEKEWAAFVADRFHYRAPAAENYPDMLARAEPFIGKVLAAPEETIAIISHGMIAQCMLKIVLGLTEEIVLQMQQPNDVMIRVRMDGENRTAEHFVAGEGPVEGLHLRERPELKPV